MQGFQVSFFTQQDRKFNGTPVCEWLLQLAKSAGLPGATLMNGMEGFGASGRMHSARFFEFADEPQQVLIIANAQQTDTLFEQIRSAGVELFYVKTPVEFGVLGKSGPE